MGIASMGAGWATNKTSKNLPIFYYLNLQYYLPQMHELLPFPDLDLPLPSPLIIGPDHAPE